MTDPIPSPTTPEPPDDPVLILIAGLAAIGVVVVVSVGLMAAGWVLRGVM